MRPHKFLRAALKRLNKISLRNPRTMLRKTISGVPLLIAHRRLPGRPLIQRTMTKHSGVARGNTQLVDNA